MTASTAPEWLRGRRMLVVDDNELMRKVMRLMLESLRFEVGVVESGAAALEALLQAQAEGRPFDVVLLDWLMPGQSGTETISRINRLGLSQVPQCVIVTGHGREEVIFAARRVGVTDVLLKPVSPSTLLDTIMSLLGPSGLEPAPAVQPAQSRMPDLATLRGARVLLVDDNAMNQEVGRGLLQTAGMQVQVAGHGAEALDWLARAPFDVVLMDLQMPVLDGLGATRAMRSKSAYHHIPVIALTANTMALDREQCFAAGMVDYVTKPIVPEQLWQALLKWVPAAGERKTPAPL
jgi:two-component system, sensor histidine kinase and response regulator